MKSLYQKFIILLITKPYVHLAISVGVIFIWRIWFIQVVYAEGREDFILEMHTHYEQVIKDINDLLQETTDPLQIINYVSAVIDPNIISQTEEEVTDKNSKFNLYTETFGILYPYLYPRPQSEILARDLYLAAAFTYNTYMVLHDKQSLQNPHILQGIFDMTFEKVSRVTQYKESQGIRYRKALLQESLATIRRLGT